MRWERGLRFPRHDEKGMMGPKGQLTRNLVSAENGPDFFATPSNFSFARWPRETMSYLSARTYISTCNESWREIMETQVFLLASMPELMILSILLRTLASRMLLWSSVSSSESTLSLLVSLRSMLASWLSSSSAS